MISQLIDKYKGIRKKKQLSKYVSYKGKYAFVGVGNHSLSNLYPVIDFLGLPLKYIYSRTLSNAEFTAQKYHATATDDLNEILNDPEITGVFVCSHPDSHFEICKRVLSAGKHLFVEKPPCKTSDELTQLINLVNGKIVQVGLQKRFASTYSTIKEQMKNPSSYKLTFQTGAYPEGNAWWDLFIHPLDLVFHLFGDVKKHTLNSSTNQETHFLTIEHQNGVIGSLELSTDYSWASPQETISVNTPDGVFDSKNIFDLTYTPKSKKIAGIPLEKVLQKPIQQQVLIANNGFVPIAENNSLMLQGYCDEINNFVQACEGNNKVPLTSLNELVKTFELLEKLG